MIKKIIAASLVLISTLATAGFPEEPVKFIVANPAGGPVDVVVRILAHRLSASWGQPVLVENKPGGSGIISTGALVKAKPDGYTLGMVVASALTIVPFAVDRLPYDPVRDLKPVSLVARTPFVFVVDRASPLKTWQDFVRESAKRDMSIGSLSIGTAFHLAWEQTARQAGIKALYVPSPSSGKTQSDLIGGLLDVALDAPSSAKGLIDSGRLRPLAVTSKERFPGLPQTPTLDELGLKGYAAQPWIGLMAPAGTPADRIAQIQQAMAALLKDPALKAQMESLGMTPVGSSSEELAATILNDRRDMEPLVKKLGIKLQ